MSRASKNLKKKQKPSRGKPISKESNTTKNYEYTSYNDCVMDLFMARIQRLKDKQPRLQIRIWV